MDNVCSTCQGAIMILCSSPLEQYRSHKAEIDETIQRVLNEGRYILGEETKAFESEFAAYIGVSHGIGVGSGTEAIHIALAVCGIGPEDEVVTVAHTAVATVAAIELTGAKPVFVDIDPDFFTLDPERIEEAITPNTKAIIPVHLYGQSAAMLPILEVAKRHCLRVIEDCAQAHGTIYHDRRVGAWSDMACFSFYPTKNLGALGDGGMIVTDKPELAEKARLLREYGWAERYISMIPGWNSRLDELQAAILRVKLRYLDSDNERRAKLASTYDKALAGLDLVTPKRRSESTHVYHLYVIRTAARDELLAYLKTRGVDALTHYPIPVHLQPAYRNSSAKNNRLLETEKAAREVLSLPMYPELPEKQLDEIVEIVQHFQRTKGL